MAKTVRRKQTLTWEEALKKQLGRILVLALR